MRVTTRSVLAVLEPLRDPDNLDPPALARLSAARGAGRGRRAGASGRRCPGVVTHARGHARSNRKAGAAGRPAPPITVQPLGNPPISALPSPSALEAPPRLVCDFHTPKSAPQV